MLSPWRALKLFALCCALTTALSAQTAPLETIEDVMAAFVEANGGEEGVSKVRSIRARGTITIAGKKRELTLLRKRPNLKRITLHMGNMLVHRGFDGEVSWRLLEAEDGRRQLSILEGEEKERFENDQSILGLLFLTEEDGVEHTLSGVEYVGRIPAYVVDSSYLGDERRAFLDARTFRVLKFEYTAGEDNESMVVESLSEYTRAGSVWVARRSERLTDGKLSGVIELDRIEVNNGLFETIFSVPEVD